MAAVLFGSKVFGALQQPLPHPRFLQNQPPLLSVRHQQRKVVRLLQLRAKGQGLQVLKLHDIPTMWQFELCLRMVEWMREIGIPMLGRGRHGKGEYGMTAASPPLFSQAFRRAIRRSCHKVNVASA